MTNGEQKCPFCKELISYLDFDITATTKGQMDQEDVLDGKATTYEIDNLLGNAQFDNFSCPECGEVIAGSEEQARDFLKGNGVGVGAGGAGFAPRLAGGTIVVAPERCVPRQGVRECSLGAACKRMAAGQPKGIRGASRRSGCSASRLSLAVSAAVRPAVTKR